jgi:peptide/nickel transport system permease protein
MLECNKFIGLRSFLGLSIIRNYALKRILEIIPLFFLISVIIFSLIHLAPGDPVKIMLAGKADPVIVEEIRNKYGLNEPIHVQYFIWLNRLLHGDLGFSYVSGRPVIEMISERLWPTVELVLLAQIFSIMLSIFLGVIAATRQYSVIDNLCTYISLTGRTLPNFYIALNLILIFSLRLGWLPATGTSTIGGQKVGIDAFIDHVKHLIMPLVALTLYYSGYLFRMIRSAMVEVLKQDYILVARSKGLSESVIIYKHALKNALLPTTTMIGLFIGYMLSGAAILETVFARPGLGSLFVALSLRRDYIALLNLNMIIALMVLISTLTTDLLYAYLDPRIRY